MKLLRKLFRLDFDEEDVLLGMHNTGKTYLTGSGQVLYNVHAETDECRAFNCVIHNPSEKAKAIGYTHYRTDRQMMERICEHGIGHPDPDAAAWAKRNGLEPDGVHGCDGCCR